MTATAPRSEANALGALREVQAPVSKGLNDVARAMHDILTTDLPIIRDVRAHLLQMRGKMFRPTLTLLSSAVNGRPEPRAVTLAAVVELMHLATLVHDDSVDHSVLRRGLPTVNALFSHQVSVIMGDFLYSRALSALVEMRDLEILRIVTDVANELTIGEMRQLGAIDALDFSEDAYCALIRAKTASLLSGACESGALCGAPDFRILLARYGERLGMAFQITDDILDYTESEATMGKPVGLDLRERKVTLPLIAALARLDSSTAARKRIDTLFAAETPDDTIIAEVIGIVAEVGGIEYARQRAAAFAEQAEETLHSLPESPARAALAEAITYVMGRRS